MATPKNWMAQMTDRCHQFLGRSQKWDAGQWTDPVRFLEAPKNWTERMTDRPRPFFGSSQKLDSPQVSNTLHNWTALR